MKTVTVEMGFKVVSPNHRIRAGFLHGVKGGKQISPLHVPEYYVGKLAKEFPYWTFYMPLSGVIVNENF